MHRVAESLRHQECQYVWNRNARNRRQRLDRKIIWMNNGLKCIKFDERMNLYIQEFQQTLNGTNQRDLHLGSSWSKCWDQEKVLKVAKEK